MINVGIIGYGYWGRNLHGAFESLKNARVTAIADIDPKAIARLEVMTSLKVEQLLRNKSVDVVAIATPAETHYEIAKSALEAGKDIFVEKPFTLEPIEAVHLKELGDRYRKIIMVDHLLLFHPAAVEMIKSVRNGEIGRIWSIHGHRIGGKVRGIENVLWSLGPHDLSLVLAMLNREDLVDLVSRGRSFLKENPKIEDIVFTQLVFRDGAMVNLQFSWTDRYKMRRFVVVGSEGTIVFDDLSQQPLVYYPNREEVTLPNVRPLDAACAHFIDCVIHGKRPIADVDSAIAVVDLLDHIDLSIKGSLW